MFILGDKKYKKTIFLFFLILITILFVILSFSYTNSGQWIFMSGLFFENKTIFNNSFNISILGTIALVVCAIGLNSSGEVMQATTNNALASPFSLGLTSSINLVYIINSAFSKGMASYLVGLISLFFIIIFNIIPSYLINKYKNRNNQNNIIFFGIAISSLLNTVTLILVHIYSLDAYVYGWITNYKISITSESLITGFVFVFLGFLIIFFNIKKISIYESLSYKSTTLGVDGNKTILISLFAASLLAIGASLVYAPLMLIGLVLPYLTKKFIIKKFSFKHSIIISSLLSIIVLMLSRIFLGLIKWNDFNLILTIILLPIWCVLEVSFKITKNKTYAKLLC